MSVSSPAQSDLLMADPSFLFSRDGIDWLHEDPGLRLSIVVPAAFMTWLQLGGAAADLQPLVAYDDMEVLEERRAELFQLLHGTPTFNSEQVELEDADRDVLLALREPGDLRAAVFADEWAFLQAHSWAVFKLHLPLDAFRDAGAVIVQYGRRLREEMVNVVIPRGEAPRALDRRLLAKAAAKWLVLGGAGVGGASLGAIGGFVFASGAAIPVVRAFDT